jgi:hypothetical protein
MKLFTTHPFARSLEWFAIALAVGLIVGLGVIRAVDPLGHGGGSIGRLEADSFPLAPIGPGAEESDTVPASEAAALPFPTELPQGYEPEHVWIRTTEAPALALRYPDDIYLVERQAEAIDYPTDSYYAALADGVAGAHTSTVNSAPAMLIDATKGLGNPSSVDVILRGVHISVLGYGGQSADELVKLTEAIPVSGSGTSSNRSADPSPQPSG